MDLKRTALTVAVAILSVTSVCGQPGTTTQAQLNGIAANLEVKVIMRTQHFPAGQHGIQISLKNTGNARMLQTQDWAIHFSLKNKLFQGENMYKGYGLEVRPGDGCSYVIRPDPKSKPAFQGLNPNEYVAFTIPATGLSVFKSDIYPNFVIAGGDGVSPRTIKSTSDDKLDFVFVHAENVSNSDPSLMTGIRRSIQTPDIRDNGGVPTSTTIPAPSSITIDESMPLKLVRLNASQVWYIWPDKKVSDVFVQRLTASLSALPDMVNRVQTFTPSTSQRSPPRGSSIIYVLHKAKPGTTDDYYRLAVGNRGADFIHITAHSEKGFANALSSLESIVGLFVVMPHLQIEDDARFEVRSVMLDVTKNFFPKATILKFLKLMRMYKLNNLVLHLADDYAWRLQMPPFMDFAELTTFASKRCHGSNACLAPEFGSGADDKSSGSGFYTDDDFKEILIAARDMRITITPRINFMGGMQAAKLAAHKRYMRLKSTNQVEADRLHIMSNNYPEITPAEKSDDTCSVKGLLDPCNEPTFEFMKDVIDGIGAIYQTANISLEEFHAGGDEQTKYLHKFASATCGEPMRTMLGMLGRAVKQTRLRVNEEAVTDPTTGSCLTAQGSYSPARVWVDFWNIVPTAHDSWNLTPDQLAYLNAPVSPVVNDSGTDPLTEPSFPPKGDAPWSKAYKCANMDYKVILGPENFFSLDSPYELDHKEVGSRKSNRFYIINLHRMFVFEPFNYYANMDLGSDRYRYLPYRVCKIWNCVNLDPTKKSNIVGMQATMDTSVVRTERTLWHLATPRMLLFAEKAWRKGPFEDLLDPTDISSMVNMSLVRYRSEMLDIEISKFLNCFGYKESGRLDAAGYQYRVTRPGVSIFFGIPFRNPGPYPAVVKVDIPGVDVEYRDRVGQDKTWRTLFTRDMATGRIEGGRNFTMPPRPKTEYIEIRILSTDGQRSSIPTRLQASTDNFWPREIPVDVRRGTCLSVLEPWTTMLEDISADQWSRILSNIQTVQQEEMTFMQQRAMTLENTFRVHRTTNPRGSVSNPVLPGITIDAVFAQIEQLLMSGANITTRRRPDIYRAMFEKEQEIMQGRERTLQQRMVDMQQEYLACPGAVASPGGAMVPGGVVGVASGPGAGAGSGGAGGPGAGQGRGQGMGQGRGLGQGQGQGRGQGQGQSRGQGQGQGRGQGRGQGQSQGRGQG